MKKIMNVIKRAWNVYCENSYQQHKAVYDAGLILF